MESHRGVPQGLVPTRKKAGDVAGGVSWIVFNGGVGAMWVTTGEYAEVRLPVAISTS